MRSQPNRNYVSNDDIQTPPALARRLVQHFQPTGLILEPCAGDGAFLKALRAHARRSRGAASTRLNTQPNRVAQPIRDSASDSEARSLNSQPSTFNSPRASHVYSCELKRGVDFFACDRRVDWIITNPPWSQIRRFLQHALSLADHVVFLFTINHLWARARLGDVKAAGFGLKELVLVDTPKNFPPSGFQLGAVHLHRGWTGPVTLTDWTSAPSTARPSTAHHARPRTDHRSPCASRATGPRR